MSIEHILEFRKCVVFVKLVAAFQDHLHKVLFKRGTFIMSSHIEKRQTVHTMKGQTVIYT